MSWFIWGRSEILGGTEIHPGQGCRLKRPKPSFQPPVHNFRAWIPSLAFPGPQFLSLYRGGGCLDQMVLIYLFRFIYLFGEVGEGRRESQADSLWNTEPNAAPSQAPWDHDLRQNQEPRCSTKWATQAPVWISFMTALIPFMRALPSGPYQFPKALPPNTITLAIRISTIEFWKDINIQTIERS